MTVLFNITNGETITILTYFSSTNLIGAFSKSEWRGVLKFCKTSPLYSLLIKTLDNKMLIIMDTNNNVFKGR